MLTKLQWRTPYGVREKKRLVSLPWLGGFYLHSYEVVYEDTVVARTSDFSEASLVARLMNAAYNLGWMEAEMDAEFNGERRVA